MLLGCPSLYQNKLKEQGVQDIVNWNKKKILNHMVIQLIRLFSHFNENSINNQNSHSQIENDETPEPKYPIEDDSENTETNKTSAIPNFMPQILPDDEIAKGVNPLNSEQREFFNVSQTLAENYVKHDGNYVEPVHILLSGNGEPGKYLFVKVIYKSRSKTLLYHCKDPGEPRVLLLGPTEISAVNIGGTTIHSVSFN